MSTTFTTLPTQRTETATALRATTSTPAKMPTPDGLTLKFILAFEIVLPCALAFVILMALVHCALKRRKKNMEGERRKEAARQVATLPVPQSQQQLQHAPTHSGSAPPHRPYHEPQNLPVPPPNRNHKRSNSLALPPTPLHSNTVACHPASLRPGVAPPDDAGEARAYPVTRHARRPSFHRASSLAPGFALSLQRNMHMRRSMSLDQAQNHPHSSPHTAAPVNSLTANQHLAPPPIPKMNPKRMLRAASSGPVGGMKALPPLPKLDTRMRRNDGQRSGGWRRMTVGHGDMDEVVDIMGIKNPVQVWDPVERRTIYCG
ncbi:hypothetical protein K458DRAFT_410073 [Lentithecium fluviatile CBS 122367]|uniref:Uncharacterized protein n=1 Tax=Lentithecium fluviatile CBS 122367 TaxID=1168545 RepID=A0A6G1IFQ6_9PLEO|nr:hypothetical protein K458DRAFT_410073 [Lentithecium fluviatile CBS 122367]